MWLIDGNSPSLDNRPNLHPALMPSESNVLSEHFAFPDSHVGRMPINFTFNADAPEFVPRQSALVSSVVDLKVHVNVQDVP